LVAAERDGDLAPAGAAGAVEVTLAAGVALALVAIGASFPFAPADFDACGAGMLAVVVWPVVLTIGVRGLLSRGRVTDHTADRQREPTTHSGSRKRSARITTSSRPSFLADIPALRRT
jgi:hypothetical protein